MKKQSKNITPIDIVGECNYSIRISREYTMPFARE